MKTVTKHIYASYDRHYVDGIGYSVISEDEKELFDGISDYKYVCEVVIPEIDKGFVMEQAIAQIDSELANLQAQIATKNAQKQQLLCIEHQEGK